MAALRLAMAPDGDKSSFPFVGSASKPLPYLYHGEESSSGELG